MINIKDTLIKEKIELLDLAKALGSVKDACRLTGYSRSSYYTFKRLYEIGGSQALKRAHRKAIIPPYMEKAIVRTAIRYPSLGRRTLTWNLKKRGFYVNESRVRAVLKRLDIITPEKRRQAFEKKEVVVNNDRHIREAIEHNKRYWFCYSVTPMQKFITERLSASDLSLP